MKNRIIIWSILMTLSLALSIVLNDWTIILGMAIGIVGSVVKHWLTIMQTDRAIEHAKTFGYGKTFTLFAIIRFLMDLLILMFAVKISVNCLLAAFVGILSLKFVLYSTHKK